MLVTGLLAACGDAPIQRGVKHLDPRLADGRASAQVLAEQLAVVSAEALDSWTLVSAAAGRAWVTPADWSVDTKTVGGVRWTANLPRSTRARLEWRRASDPAGSWPNAAAVEVSVAPDQSAQVQLAGHAAWNGTVVAVRLTPDCELGLPATLQSVEWLTRGFWPGFEALGEGEDVPASDGGLITLNDRGRRVWPASFGVPLSTDVLVPRAGRLLFDVALSASHRESLERVHLAVDVAQAGTDPTRPAGWTRVWSRQLVPRQAPTETLWQWVKVDLDDYAGERIAVRWRAWSGHGVDSVAAGLDGQATRADVLWGSPEMLGDPGDWPLPNLLLVTLDTTRADFGGAATPYFDELQARGIRFDNAYAVSNSTQPSHASILTGTYPIDHGVHDNYALLLGANRTLPERLRGLGYHTVGAVSQRFLGAGFGFGQGFDEFYQAAPGASLDGGETIELLRSRIQEWGALEPDRPVFLWLHLFDAHTPYTAPEEFVATRAELLGAAPAATVPNASPTALPELTELPPEMAFLDGINNLDLAKHLYANEVSYTDSLVENLASGLAEANLLGKTAFFVTADHGEALGEHNSYFNHQGLMAPVVRVPFFVVIPGGPAGLVVSDPVAGIDVAPTILRYAAAGQPVSMDAFRGRDLLAGLVTAPLDSPTANGERALFLEQAGQKQLAIVQGAHVLIETRTQDMQLGLVKQTGPAGQTQVVPRVVPKGFELFDLAQDPGMRVPVNDAARQAALQRALQTWLSGAWDINAGAGNRRELTPAEREQMDDLGY